MGPLTRAAAIAICLLGLTAGPAAAQAVPQTFTVTNPNDIKDNNIGDGVCATGVGAGGLGCTLRAAIQEANVNASADTIVLPAGSTPYALSRGGVDDNWLNGDL